MFSLKYHFTAAVVTNALIVTTIIVVLLWTGNPLALAGLMTLRDMPAILPYSSDDEPTDTDAQGQPMGFTADVE